MKKWIYGSIAGIGLLLLPWWARRRLYARTKIGSIAPSFIGG